MFLNCRETADALVVGEGLVVGGDQTGDGFLAHLLQDMQTDMTIEQDERAVLTRSARNHEWFDQAGLADRCGDLRILLALGNRGRQLLHRQDGGDRDLTQGRLKSWPLGRGRFTHMCHARGSLRPSTTMLGRESNPSERSKVRKFSSLSRDWNDASRNSRLPRVDWALRIMSCWRSASIR